MARQTSSAPPRPEFSRPIDVGHLEDGEERTETIEADEAERAALARRFDLEALERLWAEVRLVRRGRQVVAEARIEGDAVQACVVSLDPVPAVVRQTVEQVYDPDVRDTGEFDELVDVDDDDPPEPLVDETVDIGEMVAERFGLELDPYPRKPGATVDPRYLAPEHDEDEDGGKPGPFAALKWLKQ